MSRFSKPFLRTIIIPSKVYRDYASPDSFQTQVNKLGRKFNLAAMKQDLPEPQYATLHFHFFPSEVTVSKKPSYSNKNKEGSHAPSPEFSFTEPRIWNMKLLFSDIEEEIERKFLGKASRQSNLKAGIVSDFESGNDLFEYSDNNGEVVYKKNLQSTFEAIRILDLWRNPLEGATEPPVLELHNIGSEVFICVINDLSVKVRRWDKFTKEPTLADVNLSLREKNTTEFPASDKSYISRQDYIDIAENRLKRTVNVNIPRLK